MGGKDFMGVKGGNVGCGGKGLIPIRVAAVWVGLGLRGFLGHKAFCFEPDSPGHTD